MKDLHTVAYVMYLTDREETLGNCKCNNPVGYGKTEAEESPTAVTLKYRREV